MFGGRDAAMAATMRRDFQRNNCRDSEFLQHHVKWLIMEESRDYFADE